MKKKLMFSIIAVLLIILTLGILSGCDKGLTSPRELYLKDGVFHWDKVEGADGYLVYFNENESSRFFTWYNNLDINNENIQSSLISGQINYLWVRAVTLTPSGEPDIKSDRSRLDFAYSRQLDTPERLRLRNGSLQWGNVDNAKKYFAIAEKDGVSVEIELKYNSRTTGLTAKLEGLSAGTYNVTVIARAEGYEDSEPSNSIEFVVESSSTPVVGENWTVTFDLNYEDSTPITSQAEKGRSVARPEDPTRAGYTFGGWFFDSYGLIEAEFTKTSSKFSVTADTTLYAKWNKVEVKTTPVYVYMENCDSLTVDIYQNDVLLESGVALLKVNGKANWFRGNINENTTHIVINGDTPSDKISFDKATPYYKNGDWSSSYPTDPVDPDIPVEPTYSISVKIGTTTINLTKNDTPGAENVKLEYYGSFTLSAGDSITVVDSADKEFVNYEPECGFTGVAPYAGEYTLYAKVYDDDSHSIYVVMPTPPETVRNTIYFYNYKNWKTVKAYSWIKGTTVSNATWPGANMTAVEGHEGWYQIEVSETFNMILFNNDSDQTADQTINLDKPYFNGYVWTDGFNEYSGPTTRTVYYYNTTWSNIHAYAWTSSPNHAWPGEAMTAVEGHSGWYKIEISFEYGNIIFNNGNGGNGNQTDDIVIKEGTDVVLYYKDGQWVDSF